MGQLTSIYPLTKLASLQQTSLNFPRELACRLRRAMIFGQLRNPLRLVLKEDNSKEAVVLDKTKFLVDFENEVKNIGGSMLPNYKVDSYSTKQITIYF